MQTTILHGDCRGVLKTLPSDSVHCVTTSPPYFGLRSYGIGTENGEIGLEPTPAAYVAELVAVFREVRRVLHPSGCVFLNLGDSYNGSGGWGGPDTPSARNGSKQTTNAGSHKKIASAAPGLKPKDLIGIPWRVAFALQEPYYTGVIAQEKDRAWLAALIDGEGCFGIRKQENSGNRNPDYKPSFIPYMTVKMSDRAPLDHAARITGMGGVTEESWRVGDDSRGVRTNRPMYQWRLDGNKAVQLAHELHPYLLVKHLQARCIYWLDVSNKEKKRGRGNTVPDDVIEYREQIYQLIKALNQRSTDTVPDWMLPPPSLTEPGWYLRSDIIWAKPNPMPESVTDRPTKAHEYIFLLSKSPRYFYDWWAVREEATYGENRATFRGGGAYTNNRSFNNHAVAPTDGEVRDRPETSSRNLRTVWNIATQPYPGSHFATFPPALAERCILAGTSAHGVCPKCGAPWERQVSKETDLQSGWAKAGNPGGYGKWGAQAQGGGSTPDIRMGPVVRSEHTGWTPGCACGCEPVPAVVLDPFGGSGTTAAVARELGRDAISIELNPDYIRLQEQRIGAAPVPLFGIGD